MEILTAGKKVFHDDFMDTTMELSPREIIDYGIYVI